MELTLDRCIVEKLLDHAASAARLVGHIEEGAPDTVVEPLADHIDAMVHELSELLGTPPLIAGLAIAGRPTRAAEVALAFTPDEEVVR